MNEEELRTEVNKAVMGDGVEPSATEEPKDAAPQGVKTDPEPAKEPEKEPTKEPEPAKEPEKASEPAPEPAKPEEGKSVDQLSSQVANLTEALKKERELGKAETETLKKELADAKGMLDRLKGAFAPEPEPEPEPEQTGYLTPEQAEKLWEQKEADRAQKEEEQKKTAALKTEIADLEKKWDGAEGKPKYDDTKVLEWQKANDKLYLSPTDAFAAMNRDALIDWEVKQRLAGKKVTEVVETPSPTPGDREPSEKLPTSEAETRAAIIEAMDNAEAEV